MLKKSITNQQEEIAKHISDLIEAIDDLKTDQWVQDCFDQAAKNLNKKKLSSKEHLLIAAAVLDKDEFKVWQETYLELLHS